MSNNFSTRCLKMSYKFPAANPDDAEACKNVLSDALNRLFNSGHRISKSSCLIYVPSSCKYFDILNAMCLEFRKQPLLKGMRFRVDLSERMNEI